MTNLKEGYVLQGGRYRIIKVLGEGGFGITYLADHSLMGRYVAIKEFFMKDYCDRESTTSHVTVPTESGRAIVQNFKQKFLKEAQMIGRWDNRNIIKVYDVFEENDTAYYVMEYIRGGSLMDLVKNSGPLSEPVALSYISQVGSALSYIHERQFLHLDVKPSNILLNEKGDAVLIDFGISKHYDSDGGQTSTTPVGLSKGYAPMEQYQQGSVSKFTPATDIYSLGATLFYLLTGNNPPEAAEVYEEGLPSLPDTVSRQTRDAIVAAMLPRRKDRPQTTGEFLSMLGSVDAFSFSESNKSDNYSGNAHRVSEKSVNYGRNGYDEATVVNNSGTSESEETRVAPEDEKKSERSHNSTHNSPNQSQREGNSKETKKRINPLIGIAIAIITAIALFFMFSPGNPLNNGNGDIISIDGKRHNEVVFSSDGGNQSFFITKNFSGNYIYSINVDWCKLNYGADRFTIICDKNYSTNSRTALVQLGKEINGTPTELATLSIKQSGANVNVDRTSGNGSKQSTQAVPKQTDSPEENIFFDKTEINIQVGDVTQLKVKGYSGKIRWESEYPSVARVNNGVVTGVNEGQTMIWAECGSEIIHCLVTVSKGEKVNNTTTTTHKGISLDRTELNIKVGDIAYLKVNGYSGSVNWESEHPAVARVNNGVVSGVGEGKTMIWAKCGTEMLHCMVNVARGSGQSNSTSTSTTKTGISLDRTEASVRVGGVVFLKVNGYSGSVNWESEHPSVARVSNGVVTGVGEGKTVIWAKCGTELLRCILTVYE